MKSGGLERGMGRWSLLALIVNTVVGSAILGLPGKTFALIGSYSVVGWLPCAVVIGLVAACFAEVGSRFTRTGGPYLYAYEAFGPRTGFLVGWLSWVSRVFSLATITNLMITYASGFAPPLLAGWPRVVCITALSIVLGILMLAGARLSTTISTVLSVSKMVLLGGFVVIGLVTIGSDFQAIPTAIPQASSQEWRSAAMLMTFAFVGIESAMINTGEMRSPARDIPFALGMGLLIIVLLYVGVQIVCIEAVPDLGVTQRPIADAAYFLWGGIGRWIFSIAALVIMFGTLFAVLQTASRLPFAFAENDQMPECLGAVHSRFRTPWVAITLTATLAWILSLYSSFIGALVVTTLTRLVSYATTCGALLVLRRPRRDPSEFRVPRGSYVALAAIALTLWLMLGSSFHELFQLAVLSLAGVICHGVYIAYRERRPSSAIEIAETDAVGILDSTHEKS